ncbi:MAG: proline--tRNA ligase [Defluviitaleaceae bacterium]|nr:proline--tRNA ligase [Defluviitaleaceae bacterium]
MSKKKIDAITDMNIDFPQWYTDVVKKAELIEYAPIKGCVIFRPYGFRIWELIQNQLDNMFKAEEVENVYLPMFVPLSMMEKEKAHVEGFSPEVALVTQAGGEELADPLCIRPTSEILFCNHFADIIQSYRDLPLRYNQWCSVVRWEKTTRPFLRTSEFLWQEGHTVHTTNQEAQEQAITMFNIYAKHFEDNLAIPVIKGKKSEKEKFAGAVTTFTIESLMHDGKALQSGTSHNLGDGFARAFNITFSDKDNNLVHPYQTSWGVSSRMIGALIMVHGDNNGLVLPPKVAPIQVIIVPIAQKEKGVTERAEQLKNELAPHFRTKLDITDKSPGWKFSEYEMKGVPIRLELGPKDIAKGQAVLVRRDTGEKVFVPLDDLTKEIENLLTIIQNDLYKKAQNRLKEKTYVVDNMKDFETTLNTTPGFIKSMWCGNNVCEEKIKEQTSATIRCIPDEQETLGNTCLYCGEKAKHMVYFAKAY